MNLKEIFSLNKDIEPEELNKRLSKKEELRQIKANNKIQIKKNKANEKKKMHQCNQWFNFFTKWFFIGIILVLISILISMYFDVIDTNDWAYKIRVPAIIISNILSTIGIALFVGCIFDFSKNSEAFIGFVSNILSDIVVSKKFLATLSKKDKEQALRLILKPMDYQIDQYANIDALFEKKIQESMTMFDTNFKANMVLNVEARLENEKVYCFSTVTYTIYRVNNKFESLKVYFEKENSESSDVRIISPLGEKSIKKEEGTSATKVTMGGIQYDYYNFVIPPEYNQFDHLTIKRTTKEPGHDHWINFIWQTITPYEGLSCSIKCFDGLTIKEQMIFDNKAYYHIELSEDKSKIEITSSQWLDSNTGFAIVISK